jgi:hypothetical protein
MKHCYVRVPKSISSLRDLLVGVALCMTRIARRGHSVGAESLAGRQLRGGHVMIALGEAPLLAAGKTKLSPQSPFRLREFVYFGPEEPRPSHQHGGPGALSQQHARLPHAAVGPDVERGRPPQQRRIGQSRGPSRRSRRRESRRRRRLQALRQELLGIRVAGYGHSRPPPM